MTRLLVTLWNVPHLVRKHAVVAISVAAVSCLSTAIVHWSRPFPAENHAWEHSLFGDFPEERPVRESRAAIERIGVNEKIPSSPAGQLPQPAKAQRDQTSPNERIGQDSPFFVSQAQFAEPSKTRRPKISLTGGISRADRGAAWLSGAIEEVTAEEELSHPFKNETQRDEQFSVK